MCIDDVEGMPLQVSSQCQHTTQAFLANGKRLDQHPKTWSLLKDTGFRGTDKPDIVPAINQALGLGQNTNLLTAPATRRFSVQDSHFASATDSA